MSPSWKQTVAPTGRKGWITVAAVAAALMVGGLLTSYFLPHASHAREQPPAGPAKTSPAGLEYQPPTLPDAPTPAAMLLRLGVGTAAVLGLCVVTLWAGKRWLKPGPPTTPSKGEIQLIETFSLGGRCAVHLLKVGQSQVLVGVDAGGIKSMLGVADFAEELAEQRVASGPP